ncbi:DUF262 domain-containing protein [Phormidium tenue]|uniref:DUF262 domain-containing protein n=1 Tax=Phormidium tenue NIES-30 TaxID=549789 RepID=A0A1U7IYC2_9CYAN|nr:DUF262 domain-containing protein [Phormidium tenue]MBD2232766.1 DUF262 domain-containing protein [Phormidium tenue FACHB-1052]OKH43702.1 hypothetical protein NIES30_24430 [Phormidium tenue NIES-30]
MEQQLSSLSKIFTERIYRIPDYQRGYAWTEKQLKDFLGDLDQLENGKNHYLGVLTLEEVPESIYSSWKDDIWIIDAKSYIPYYIVDGQQRLTTAIILIQSIIESVNSELMLNYSTIGEIRKKFIYDSKDSGISRSYIFGYERDNPSYEFLKTKIFLEHSETSETPQETIYTHNLELSKKFFLEKLEGNSVKEKETLYKKLTQNLLFNIYTISSDIDVFVAFETMNNRGKPLSYLELLKNRLIYLSTKFDVEDYEREKLRRSINEAWKTIYHYLGRNKNKPLDDDLFLSNHFSVYFEKASDSREAFIYDVDPVTARILHRRSRGNYSTYLLEKKFTVKSLKLEKEKSEPKISSQQKNDLPALEPLSLNEVYDYVTSLQKSVELWYKILNPEDSDFAPEVKTWLDKLVRLSRRSDFFPSAPLIMIFFLKETHSRERVRLLKVLENIGFFELIFDPQELYFFLELPRLNMTDLAIKLSKDEISPSKLIKQLEEVYGKFSSSKALKFGLSTKIKDNGFYKWPGIKYFLFEYDLDLQSRSKTNRKKLNWQDFADFDYKTIEHIYPQNPRKECWTSLFEKYSSKERSLLRHSLGNLLPLSSPKNSSFSNKCFSEKISNDKNTTGYRYGSYSENEITKYKDWTSKEILERGIRLLDFMEKRWNFSLGTEQEKIEFLNLGFVLEKE